MIDLKMLREGIERINSNSPIVITHYVHFDKNTGKVSAVSNKEIDTTDNIGCIPIHKDKAVLYLTAERPLSEITVQFDTKLKKYVILDGRDSADRYPSGLIEIKETKNAEADLTIQRNKKKKCWTLRLGDSMRTSIVENKVSLNRWINVYLTQKNNPNALIRSIDAKLEHLVNNTEVSVDFLSPKLDEELGKSKFSLYTSLYFDSYQLVNK